MKPEDITEGMNVTYWPIRHSDGSFEGEPLHTEVTSAAWMINPGRKGIPALWVCRIAGKAGYINVTHLTTR